MPSPIPFRLPAALPPLAALALLAGCATPPAASPPPEFSAYVVMGEQGAAVARVVTSAANCPALASDGKALAMTVRALPATLAQRPTASKPEDSKASVFPMLTCEAVLPAGTASASVYGQPLPVPRAAPRRIAVIGDSGCRMKKKDNEFQDCHDVQQFPLATVAAAAAAWKPDLVVHVGDYLYRENACPDGKAGCAGSPWGYGWDAWHADLFQPAAPLLQAAPWVVLRGNHESCQRAGQGWWRLLDPRPLQPGRDCNAAADDSLGDYSDPYAVPLGGDAQLLVVDSAATTWKGFKPGAPGFERYRDAYRKLDILSQQATWNFALMHHPILGVGVELKPDGGYLWHKGDLGLQQSFGSLNPGLLPKNVQTVLSGHEHLWEQLSFSSGHPSQFIAGFSGSLEDTVPMPPVLPPEVLPAPGVAIEHFSTWIDGFGFMGLERTGPGDWDVTVFDRHGQIKNRCKIAGRHSVCGVAQVK
ncbi:metallophosphoesterase [Pseudoduganella ginsengisoli]|uniref:metallophosphoesterase family protein n=1 Tax=Pseudoduganella ginsengisoli TaxID=1462440 RepID=UPI001E361BD2|nr:metallophosphoesterase [Pseudoduganella ginsengisoli]